MSEATPSVLTDDLRAELEAREAARYRLRPGDYVDGLRVEGGLGIGTFGEVYAVNDAALGGTYALKLLRRKELGAREAFRREAMLLARLRHPNIVRVMRAGEWQDVPYLVMEKLSSLSEHPDGPQVLGWILALCGALAELNRQGVIHGDIKYGNVLWDAERRQPVLTDLGSVTPLCSAKLPAPSADVFALAALTRRLLPERCLKSGSPWRTVLTEALVADPLLRLPTPGALAQRLCAVFGKRRLASRPIPGCHRLRG